MYGYVQVDHILGLKPGTSRRWIDGYQRSGISYPPVIRTESTNDDLVTWGEFVEARFLSEYRDQGALVARMRPAVELLRERLGTRYPLASAQTWLHVDGQELVQEVQNEVGLDKELSFVVVRNGQGLLDWSPRAEHFLNSLHWENEVVTRLLPSDDDPDVSVDPLRSFGEPSVRSVRTETIRELFVAGDSIATIADYYELDEGLVHAAVRFELRSLSISDRVA